MNKVANRVKRKYINKWIGNYEYKIKKVQEHTIELEQQKISQNFLIKV